MKKRFLIMMLGAFIALMFLPAVSMAQTGGAAPIVDDLGGISD